MMNNTLLNLILGEDFMNKPVGTDYKGMTEAEYMKKKTNEFLKNKSKK